MEKIFTIIDHGFSVEEEMREGLRIHVCYYDDKHYARDFYGELSTDLTNEMLGWFLANEELDYDEDLTTKFTEVWYDTSAGELVEMKREETTYSDELIREFAGLQRAILSDGSNDTGLC